MNKLNELLNELGISKVRLAKYLGVSRQMLYNYLALENFKDWPKEKLTKLYSLLNIETEKELVDLKNLEGKFMYDAGFVSTSLLPQQSFFGKDIEKGKNYNIMIEYMVPQDFTDGIYIGNNASFSYHPHEQEYLINAGNISRVTSVKVNEDDTAKICAIVIPKFLYDDYYKGKESKSK